MATHVRPRRRAGAACHPCPALPRYRRIAAAYGAGGKWPHLLRGGGLEGGRWRCLRTRTLVRKSVGSVKRVYGSVDSVGRMVFKKRNKRKHSQHDQRETRTRYKTST